jgi:hypothetical protein
VNRTDKFRSGSLDRVKTAAGWCYYIRFQHTSADGRVSLWGSQALYVSAYALATVLVYAAELNVIAAVFVELKGSCRRFGTLKPWGGIALLLSVAVLAFGSLEHPHHSSRCIVLLYSIKQVGGVFRTMALLTVAFYGSLIATSWRGRTGIVWLATSINVGSEFFCTALSVSFPQYEPVLRHGPDAGFLLALRGRAQERSCGP